MKRWRFVSKVEVNCVTGGTEVRLHLLGGKVGAFDQAEYIVDAPAAGTLVQAQVQRQCPGSSPQTFTVLLMAEGGSTSPFVGVLDAEGGRCGVSLSNYRVLMTNMEGTWDTRFPWTASVQDARLTAGIQPSTVYCAAAPSPQPPAASPMSTS